MRPFQWMTLGVFALFMGVLVVVTVVCSKRVPSKIAINVAREGL